MKRRIVALLPAATEMVYALGIGEALVGVSHECDFPAQARGLPVVSRPAVDLEGLTLEAIDRAIGERVARGESVYSIDETLLRELQPDLIVTQNLCQVCAPSGNELSVALRALRRQPDVLFMSPSSIADIERNVLDLGEATGTLPAARALVSRGRERMAAVHQGLRGAPLRRVFVAEWIDPLFCCGHWVAEMVELAGGADVLGRKGRDSARVAWDDVRRAAAEVVVASPCGFHLDAAVEQAQRLALLPGFAELPAARSRDVYAVDADAYFVRPGPRVVDGIELLASLLHPGRFPPPLPGRSAGVAATPA
jgi:iron complex transport system substrate-binding protein